MKTFLLATTLASTLVFSATASAASNNVKASNFSNTWVEASFTDFDSGLDGFKVEGSYALNEHLNVIGTAGLFDDTGIDAQLLTLGLSYAIGLATTKKSDILIHAEFASSKVDFDNPNIRSEDDRGLILGTEFRFQALDVLELYADLSYTTLWDNDLMIEGGARLEVAEDIQINAGLQLSDDDMLYLGARFSF
ncbi:MAG: outer membrane beta-barrel protein [Pseudomonadales bacterium]|nr:outer membrane beta-barrel protein [Pseudomonadales bacterium]